ncbi:MAG: GNAT family N-acetyltransferase [Dehalococcoidia bacterium]|nr:GNAT family N-acetyltransferase [Dehalococcoidia bacterium]
MDIALRPVEPRDVPALYAIHRDAIGEYVVATWGAWDNEIQRGYFRDRVARGHMQAIEVDGALAGIWEVGERKASLHLENIELASWLHRRGIGTHLVQQLQQQADAARPRRSRSRCSASIRPTGSTAASASPRQAVMPRTSRCAGSLSDADNCVYRLFSRAGHRPR